MSAQAVLQNWLDDFHYMARMMDWSVITYTCHTFVIGRGHRMLMLERLIRDLLDDGAVFTMIEAAAREFAERTPASTDGTSAAR